MTPDELDAAIRQELRFAARLAPDAGPVRRRVLLAAEALGPESVSPRGLRAWTVPLLAAAAVLVVLGLTAAAQTLRADRAPAPPAGISTPAPIPTSTSPSPSASTTQSPSRTAASRTTSPAAGGRSSAAGSRSVDPGSGSSVPQDWYQGLEVAELPHTPGLCPAPLTVGHASDMGAPTISVPGEPAPLWLLTVTCIGGDSSHPMPLEVFRYRPGGPELVQTLAYEPTDTPSLLVASIAVGSGRLTLGEQAYAPGDFSCCRSLRFSQDFTWDNARSRFVAGPRVDTLLPCTGEQLTVTGSPLSSQSDAAGVLLSYVNSGKDPCTLTGYPGAALVDGASQPLADAARTPAGFFGGLTSGEAPRVVLYGSVTGSAVIEWTTAQHGDSQCHQDAELLSTPPGTTATASYGVQPMVCGLQVHPVVAGGTGKQQPATP
jgi:hypothetical protein